MSDPFRVDVTDFGAKAGGLDNAPAFQLSHDIVAARLELARSANPQSRAVGTVYIPQNSLPYYLDSPVWIDAPYIAVVGDGEGSSVVARSCRPLFIVGLRREAVVGGLTLTPDASYRPDLCGVLDATAASAPGQRWGFRSNGDSFIQAQATPLDAGGMGQWNTPDAWAETTGLTVEFAIKGDPGPIVAIGVPGKNEVFPFAIYCDAPGSYVVLFCTQTAPFALPVCRRFGFLTAGLRVTVQIDLAKGRVSAFSDGVQLATSIVLGPALVPGLTFAENHCYPLLIGDDGGARPSLGNVSGRRFDLYGFCLSRTIRYRDDVAVQTRVGGGPITDRYRYYTARFGHDDEADSGMIGCLDFTDPPGTRTMTVRGGQAGNDSVACAFLLHSLQTAPGGIARNALCDLLLIGRNQYGQNVAVGQVLELDLTRIRSVAAYHAIGSLANGANYVVRVRACYLDGVDAGYFGLDQLVTLDDVTFSGAGRSTMRFVGCVVDVDRAIVEFSCPWNQCTAMMHAGDYGGNYAFRHIIVDYEGGAYRRAAFYAETHPYAPTTSLRLQDVYLGSTGDVPHVQLREVLPHNPKAVCLIDNVQAWQIPIRPVVDSVPPWSVVDIARVAP